VSPFIKTLIYAKIGSNRTIFDRHASPEMEIHILALSCLLTREKSTFINNHKMGFVNPLPDLI
jgi:hypothetical protein